MKTTSIADSMVGRPACVAVQECTTQGFALSIQRTRRPTKHWIVPIGLALFGVACAMLGFYGAAVWAVVLASFVRGLWNFGRCRITVDSGRLTSGRTVLALEPGDRVGVDLTDKYITGMYIWRRDGQPVAFLDTIGLDVAVREWLADVLRDYIRDLDDVP